MADNILVMDHITKEFPGVKALDNVNLEVQRGEIHALIGENGAGKSTLMNVLSGQYPYGSYTGTVTYEGEECKFKNLNDSEAKGIVIIHQELALIPLLSIGENMFLGNEIKNKSGSIDWDRTYSEAEKHMAQVGLHESAQTLIKDIGTGKQQLVEIAKALAKNVKLLIMDEPTAPLTDNEVEILFKLVRNLKKRGVSIIYISHRMDERFELADRITVMRDGEVIKTVNKEDTNKNQLIYDMVGRKLTETYPERHPKLGKTLLEVKNLCGSSNEETTFSVREGEIVGLAGLVGAGRTEIARLIIGADKKYSGTVCVDGKEVTIHSPKDAIQHGIAYVSEDRKNQGVLLKMSIRWNITLPILRELSKMTFINFKEENKCVDKYKDALRIKTPSINQLVGNLSGGNQQKVAVAKWLASESKILILDEPTRGIDVGAKQEIYELINRLTDEGLAIIMISSEMEEIMGMSDRMLVMAEGRIVGELDREEFSQNQIMKYASNITD